LFRSGKGQAVPGVLGGGGGGGTALLERIGGSRFGRGYSASVVLIVGV
jgi:hypothetical protein